MMDGWPSALVQLRFTDLRQGQAGSPFRRMPDTLALVQIDTSQGLVSLGLHIVCLQYAML